MKTSIPYSRVIAVVVGATLWLAAISGGAEPPTRGKKTPETQPARESAESYLVKGKSISASLEKSRSPLAEGGVVLLTEAPGAAEAEWKEDLSVMERILRDAIRRVGDEDAPMAMGIKLTTIGRGSPMYLEGCGAVFSATVAWPLAPAGLAGGANGEVTRPPVSAWERAKRELNGGGAMGQTKGNSSPHVFEQVKVDQLVDSIMRALPEATNIRHLKDNEFVFVTVSGLDGGGNALRLTMKARKSDIDDAARWSMKPQDFRQRVATRIG